MHDEELNKLTSANEETRAKYLRLQTDMLKQLCAANAVQADMLKQLAAINAVLNAIGEDPELDIPTVGTDSPTDDILEYLTQQGKPCHQRDIIKAVGDKRKEKYHIG